MASWLPGSTAARIAPRRAFNALTSAALCCARRCWRIPLPQTSNCDPLTRARDTGDPAFTPAAGETDFDGQSRRFGGRVDIGADEVTVLPTLLSPQRQGNGQFLIRVLGEVGLNYKLQASTNLTSWTSLATNTASSSAVDFTDTPGARSRRHYRAIAR